MIIISNYGNKWGHNQKPMKPKLNKAGKQELTETRLNVSINLTLHPPLGRHILAP